MALMLGVSKRTIENRMTEYALTKKSRFSEIEDDMLDSFVERIVTNFPRSGKGYDLSSCSFKSWLRIIGTFRKNSPTFGSIVLLSVNTKCMCMCLSVP